MGGCVYNLDMAHTVTTLSPSDLDVYRKALKNRRVAVESLANSRFKKACEVADRAAALLREEFSVKKVMVFGSLVHPHLFHSRSDVDLAVWGLDERQYFRAVGILQSLEPEIEVDLIAFEKATGSMQEVILREGKEL